MINDNNVILHIVILFVSVIGGLEDHHLAGIQYGGLRPHQASEHINNPNAVVIHTQQVSPSPSVDIQGLVQGFPT